MRATFLLLAALAACGTAAADRAPAPPPALACLDSIRAGRDTLVFSDVEIADETFDATGTEISLWGEAGGWRGAARDAEGELGDPIPLQSLTLDARSGRLAFAYPNDTTNLVRFEGTVSCERLAGGWQLYPGVRREDSVLPRVPRSGYTR